MHNRCDLYFENLGLLSWTVIWCLEGKSVVSCKSLWPWKEKCYILELFDVWRWTSLVSCNSFWSLEGTNVLSCNYLWSLVMNIKSWKSFLGAKLMTLMFKHFFSSSSSHIILLTELPVSDNKECNYYLFWELGKNTMTAFCGQNPTLQNVNISLTNIY
jgi:hypothetical protein